MSKSAAARVVESNCSFISSLMVKDVSDICRKPAFHVRFDKSCGTGQLLNNRPVLLKETCGRNGKPKNHVRSLRDPNQTVMIA